MSYHDENEDADFNQENQLPPILQSSEIFENVTISSLRSSSSQESDSSLTIKKYPWLNAYFGRRTRDNKQLVFCRSCNQEYSSRSLPRMEAHFNKCLKTDKSGRPVISEQPSYSDREISELWTEVCIENNISFKTVESSSFKAFVTQLTRSHRPWKIPERRAISEIYIPKMSNKIFEDFKKDLKNNVISDVSVEFDHWKDKSKKDYLGVIATDHLGRSHLLDLRDVSHRDKSAEVIIDEMTQVLRTLPRNSVNALISDSASSCKRARRLLVETEEFQYTIQHRCLAHLFNRVGSRITAGNRWMSDAILSASKITTWISGSSFWLAHIEHLNLNRPKIACAVRWYSTVNMLESLVSLKTVIMEDFAPTLEGEKAQLVSTLSWHELDEILEVLRPINKCIGSLERKDASLGEAFREILTYAKELFVDPTPTIATIAARKSFLWYFNTTRLSSPEFGLYLAAYILDPRFRADYVTPDGAYLALEAIVKVGVKTGITMQVLQSTVIYQDFDNYRNFVDCYLPVDMSQKAAAYWREKTNLSPLARIAIRLANLRATSANIERTFSTLSYIQGKNRTQLRKQTFAHMGRIKLTLKDMPDDPDDFDEHDLEDETDFSHSDDFFDSLDNTLNSSNITDSNITDSSLTDLPEWLEHQDIETKAYYVDFFKYIDFSIVNARNIRENRSSSLASDEEIRETIRLHRASQESRQSGIIIDSASQIAEYGALPDDSFVLNSE